LKNNEVKSSPKKVKWLVEVLLFLGMIMFSAIIAFLLFQFQDYFRVSLSSFGWVAYILIFIVTMLSSATILVPAPGIAFVLAAATVWDPTFIAIAAGTGDAVGEMTAYWVGYVGERIIVDEHIPAYQKAVTWMNRYGEWTVFGDALVPIIPFDLVGMAAGALKLRWWVCLLATLAGKLPRAFIVAYMGHQIPLLIHPWTF
jgi:uncharacterized membrane protein YdjX (TVP38/TMEM64 family)